MTTRFIALLLATLSFGPSFAHVLEAWPRLTKWSPELWRETTVFNSQYQLFGLLGGPLDVATIIALVVMILVERHQRNELLFSLFAAICFTLGLIAWLTIVAPANSVLSTWTSGNLPQNFLQIRNRWEIGHMIVAGLKLAGLIALFTAVTLQIKQR